MRISDLGEPICEFVCGNTAYVSFCLCYRMLDYSILSIAWSEQNGASRYSIVQIVLRLLHVLLLCGFIISVDQYQRVAKAHSDLRHFHSFELCHLLWNRTRLLKLTETLNKSFF